MSPNQLYLLELAQKGDSNAIAALMNQTLQPKGISAMVKQKDGCLQVLVRSEQPMAQKALVGFITQGITRLNLEAINSIAIYARRDGQTSTDWAERIQLKEPLAEVVHTASITTVEPQENLQVSLPTKPAKKVSLILAGSSIVAGLILLPTVILFVIAVIIASGVTWQKTKKGKTEQNELNRIWCQSFLCVFGGFLALGLLLPALFPNLSKPQPNTAIAPAPELAKARGIGVSRSMIQDVFKQSPVSFTFESAAPVEGQPFTIGTSPKSAYSTLALMGADDNLNKVMISSTISRDDPRTAQLGTAYIHLLIQKVVPEWKDSYTWLNQAIQDLESGQDEISKNYGDLEISIIMTNFNSNVVMIMLSIEPNKK